MIFREDCLSAIKKLRTKSALETTDENIIATIHLMNCHGLDINAALDQSSRSGNDHGIDAWFYDEQKDELYIYQSKLTESKTATIKGLKDLENAKDWLEKVIIDGYLEKVPNDNHCLFNLFNQLSSKRIHVKKIHFGLISLFEKMEIEDLQECEDFENTLTKSKLNQFIIKERGGKLSFKISDFNLEKNIPTTKKTYQISKIPKASLSLRNNTNLDLAYLTLYSLIELYRQRGELLFDKNVRLSLINSRDARERLLHPMEETLENIVTGNLNPNIFSFYHIGVTLAASSSIPEGSDILNIEAPSIINGCQTIVIANQFLKKLEKEGKQEKIDRFKEIKVIAKVVIGTNNEELREITNSNNRQNPIENWQLFSNEPIHIEIESVLKDYGIFYERQKGKYDSIMKHVDLAKNYLNSNGNYIKVLDLAQIIALSRRNLQWSAKPSEIFTKKDNHDLIFDGQVPKSHNDIVFIFNMHKALKRGLLNYLNLPVHQNSSAQSIFKKPIIRAYTFHLGLIYYYQRSDKWTLRRDYSTCLSKIANQKLVDESQSFYRSVVTQIKQWYTDLSDNLNKEISAKTMDKFFMDKAIELGINYEGFIPFTRTSINWSEYFSD